MASLMTVYDPLGGILATCNEECYSAKNLECHCVCAGVNHGIGFKKAQSETVRNGRKMIGDFIARNGLKTSASSLMDEDLKQVELFL